MAPMLSMHIFTYRGLAAHGMLSAYEPDGDAMTYEVISYPSNGVLTLEDAATGAYIYEPQGDFVGTDSFGYVARDCYGNYSAGATVTVRVDVPGTQVRYEDMVEGRAYNAALALTEAGVMSGTQVGNQHYFYPEKNVTRAEFLVMAMNAVGITDLPTCEATAFFDDGAIAPSMKGYVAAAYTMGIISGTGVGGELCFLPDEEITRAQAAVMVQNVLQAPLPETAAVFAGPALPVWAQDSVLALDHAGLKLDCSDHDRSLTRREAANLLYQLEDQLA
jgi:hypothetical protein